MWKLLQKKRKTGFTLIEILIVMAILVILLSFVMIKLRPLQHRREAFDIKRRNDIRALQHSVSQYTIDKSAIPPGMPVGPPSSAKWVCQQAITGTACTGSPVNGIDLSSLVPTYLASIPVDPSMTGSIITGYKLYSDGEDFYPLAPYLASNPAPAGLPSSATSSTPQTPTMIAHWKLDEVSGTSATDSSGNGRSGTLVNGPTWTTGILSGGLQFDGANDTVTAPHSTAFDGLTSLSLSTWIMPYSWRNAQIAGISDMYSISMRSDGRLEFSIKPFLTSAVSTSTAPSNQWTHVSLVYNGSTVSLYVNGILDTSVSVSGTIASTTTAFAIGGTATGYYHGKVDDTQWTKTALLASDVPTIVAAAVPFSTSQVGYWKFDDGAGASARDSSGNGFTASLINGPTWVSTSTPPSNFSNSYSLKFDGSDDYARVPYSSKLDFRNATSFSVATWAYLSTNMPGASLANMLTLYERGWLMYTYGNLIRMYVTSSSASAQASATVSSAGWHHVASTWDGERLKLYMDGVLASDQACTWAPANSISSAVIIGGYYGYGADNGGRPDYLFNEKIDELRILNRPLSAAEVKSLASGNSLPY